ncbi:GNAT family N-acetyltransferase [Streptosporangiaceae bacterium NEAU-GS5]|nr:GNAT family N-acetyltransferase [Streptosporangiaceae bacterium NEAU-GS5]
MTVDDLDAALDNRARAFGPADPDDTARWRKMMDEILPQGRYLGAFDGPRLVGTSRIIEFRQWWHGRAQSMAGIASVTVAPEDRGRGAGRRIMQATLDRCAELGHTVSALYPATTPLYRGMGWEHAGAQLKATFPAEALRTLRGPDVKLRRMVPGDAPEALAIVDRVHAATRACGPLVWTEASLRRFLGAYDDFSYLADDGFVIYRWDGGDIEIDTLVAGSEATARALWSLVGSASSIASTVTAPVEPDDPILWLTRERGHDKVDPTRWMFRLVGLVDALEGRGYPAAVAADVAVTVSDPWRPANTGTWRLEIAGGACQVTPAGPAPAYGQAPELGIGAMSALFAGVSTGALRRAGLMTGPAGSDEALDAAFAAKPYMLDYF